MRKILKISLVILSLTAMTYANVSITASSYQEQTVVSQDGEKSSEWVSAKKVVPGTVIKYVNSLNNSENKLATKLVVTNLVPDNMEYVADSASCQTGCVLSYSVDGGKSYRQPSELFVGAGEKRHMANAREYTNIKWVIEQLKAKSQSNVEYKARLK